MNLLQLHNGSKHFGTKTLFDRATFAINEGEHVGVIGPNGAGKTTLFKILVGQLELDQGQLTTAKSLRVGYLEQEAEWRLDQSAEKYLEENCTKPLWDLKRLGRDIGLTQAHFASPLHELSGGYRMRMKLLYLIGQEPNLMLLDEPTNFLDLESVLALESFLQSYNGAFLLISHDREFLKRTTEYTLEVEAGDITKFPGNIDDYFEQKAELRAVLEAQAANLDAKRKHMQDFVDRFRAKATKARQAQSRLKQLEKMDRIELRDLPVRARIRVPAPIHTGRESLALRGADLGYGAGEPAAKTILRQVNLRLERGDHLGVVGFNGAGKSTLLKSLAGALPLLAGERELGYQVSLSYFSQHSTDQLEMADTVLDSLQRAAHRDLDRQDILNMAGSLLFSGDDIHKRVRVLSGGEKSRVALGQILLRKSPLLLLDEPTNHLDFDTVEALTEALRDYQGSVVVVSHDRGFIGRIATRILEIRDGRVETYPGTYDEYVWSLKKGALAERAADDPPSRDAAAPVEPKKFNFKEKSKELQGAIKERQRKILKCEELVQASEKKREELNTALLTAQGPQAATLAKELGLLSQEIHRLEEDMLRHMEEQDEFSRQLEDLRK
ncbi:MAG TPA: ABC-F family ATP-binding cassette domain-containing protein [Bdellovibrionales bacterium]|nr:ABC-F family ATP-binding cassette domain-containing protein [Bdellovibrionales bacterium]